MQQGFTRSLPLIIINLWLPFIPYHQPINKHTLTHTLLFLESFSLTQIVDVLLVCFLLYQCYQLIKESVAIKIILGFLALYSLGWLAKKAGMPLMGHIVKGLKDIASIALVVIFQYEIRKLSLPLIKNTDVIISNYYF